MPQKRKNRHQRIMSSKYSWILLILTIILLAIIVKQFFNDPEIYITNIRWKDNANFCNVKYNLKNESQSAYNINFTIRIFAIRDRGFFLNGIKSMSVTLYPNQSVDYDENVDIIPINRTKKVQVTIDNFNKL